MCKGRPYSNRYVYNSKEPIVKTAEVFASEGKGSRDSVTILEQLVSDEGNEANDNFKLSSEKDMLIFKLGRIEKSLYKKGYLKRSKQLLTNLIINPLFLGTSYHLQY